MKISCRSLIIKKISKKDVVNKEKLISLVRENLKKDPIIIKKFNEYSIPLSDIDNIPIEFANLDVSAKTKNKKIYLNNRMLEQENPIIEVSHYLVHELIHYLQQESGNTSGIKNNEDYLDKDTEIESFKAQIDFKKRQESPQDAKEYTEKLLDYHDIHGKERKEKEQILLGK